MDAIALMASAMHAAESRLDVSAGNLANVSTSNFHRRIARARLTAAGVRVATNVDVAAPPLARTGRGFDLSASAGSFAVRDRDGRVREIRSGSFERAADGSLADDRGRTLLGTTGVLHVPGDASVDARGIVRSGSGIVGHLRTSSGARVVSGFLAASGVNAIDEMVAVLDAQRAFETAAKTLGALDGVREKAASQIASVTA